MSKVSGEYERGAKHTGQSLAAEVRRWQQRLGSALNSYYASGKPVRTAAAQRLFDLADQAVEAGFSLQELGVQIPRDAFVQAMKGSVKPREMAAAIRETFPEGILAAMVTSTNSGVRV